MPVYLYWNFFLFLNFMLALINVCYIHFSFSFSDGISLFLRNISALINFDFEHCVKYQVSLC
jgi:hypothetical protein